MRDTSIFCTFVRLYAVPISKGVPNGIITAKRMGDAVQKTIINNKIIYNYGDFGKVQSCHNRG